MVIQTWERKQAQESLIGAKFFTKRPQIWLLPEDLCGKMSGGQWQLPLLFAAPCIERCLIFLALWMACPSFSSNPTQMPILHFTRNGLLRMCKFELYRAIFLTQICFKLAVWNIGGMVYLNVKQLFLQGLLPLRKESKALMAPRLSFRANHAIRPWALYKRNIALYLLHENVLKLTRCAAQSTSIF